MGIAPKCLLHLPAPYPLEPDFVNQTGDFSTGFYICSAKTEPGQLLTSYREKTEAPRLCVMDTGIDRSGIINGALQKGSPLISAQKDSQDNVGKEGVSSDTSAPVDLVNAIDNMGLLSYATSTAADSWSLISNIAKYSTKIPGARFVPGLNVAVTIMEGYNAHKSIKGGDKPIASCRTANSLACFGNILDNIGAGFIAAKHSGICLGLATSLWGFSGCMALLGGVGEIRNGLGKGKGKENENEGKAKDNTLIAIGAMDVTSGVTTIAGSALLALGVGGPVALGLYVVACACDLLSISTFYYSKFSKEKQGDNKGGL
jgi:hypothetical protein